MQSIQNAPSRWYEHNILGGRKGFAGFSAKDCCHPRISGLLFKGISDKLEIK
jgi:hypothetical protein